MSLADLPPLENGGPVASAFEFMPAWRFYLPLVPHIAVLAFKHGGLSTLTAANPAVKGGGLVGESKSEILDLVTGDARKSIAPYLRLRREAGALPNTIEQQMRQAGVSFPAVAKPDISCRGAGVRTIANMDELGKYWYSFPESADLVLQARISHEPEAGIFYIRHPEEEHAQIFSLTLKYTQSVVGDGVTSLRGLIMRDPRAALSAKVYLSKPTLDLEHIPQREARVTLNFAGNHCRGAVFRDGHDFITPELTAAIDRIMRSMPEFHFGRMDVRFESLEKLQQGSGFSIIEINGVGSEATHIWDNRFTLSAARATLRDQFAHAYEIGATMRARGAQPLSLFRLISMWLKERHLTGRYPVSE